MVRKPRQDDPTINDSGSSSDDKFRSEKKDLKPKCPHIKKAINIQYLRKMFKTTKVENEKCVECTKQSNGDIDAGDYEIDRTLWMCLQCGTNLCGRSVNKHALKHNQVSWNIYIISNNIFN